MALAGYLPPIVAQIIADTKGLTAGVGVAKKELGTLEGAFTKLAGVGKYALIGLGVSAAAIGYESVKLAMNFDQTMELIATQAGAGQSEVDKLKGSVLALAPAVGIGPQKLAEGLYHIESTGYRGQAALDILTASAKLAATGMADLDTVTYAMSGTMSAGMKDIKDAADATSYLNQIVGSGDMKMQDLAAAIGTGVLPSFKSAGLGMTDFGAALATITDNSTPADEAATRLRMTISLMAAPSGKAVDALASIGLSSTSLADDMRKPNGLLVAVMDLKKHLESAGLTASQQNAVIEHAFGGGKTSGAILTLLDESDRLAKKYTDMGTQATRAKAQQEAWAEQQKQFKQQLNELIAQLQAWGVKIGNWLIPKIQELVRWLGSVVGWLEKHKGVAQALAVIIGSVLVVAIAAYTVAMIQAAIATIGATWPILLIIAAVAALAFGIFELVKHWSTVWNWIKQITSDVWHWIYQYIWVDGIYKAFANVKDWLKNLQNWWGDAWNAIGSALKWVWDHTIGPIINFISAGIRDVTNAFNALTGGTGASAPTVRGNAFDSLPHHDKGGFVAGPIGSPQLIVAHGGEYVLTADQARGIGRTAPASSAAAQPITLHATFVMPDGRQIRTEVLRYGRRAGLNASDLFSDAAVQGSLVRS